MASPSRATGELLDFSDGQIGDVPSLSHTGLSNHDRSRRKIDARRQRGRRKHSIQASMPHQFFDRDLPGRQVSRMMGGHAHLRHRRQQRMIRDAGILGDHLIQHGADGLLPHRRQDGLRALKGFDGFVAGSARGQKDDGGSEMLVTKGGDEVNRMDGGRHAASFPWRWRRDPTR